RHHEPTSSPTRRSSDLATGAYYPQAAVAQVGGAPTIAVPEAAQQLASLVASYAETPREPAAVVTEPVLARQYAVQSSDALRGQRSEEHTSELQSRENIV